MSNWAEKLIDELRSQEPPTPDASGSHAVEPLRTHYEATVRVCKAAVERIQEALRAPVNQQGVTGEDRIRWVFGTRSLNVRLDPDGEKYFVSVDLGDDLIITEINVDETGTQRSHGEAIHSEEVAERFVSLLFRGR
jgi:hypothetical protein